MEAIHKANYFVIWTTITLMFLLLPVLKPLVDTHFVPSIVTSYAGEIGKNLFSAALNGIVAVGIYRSLAWAVHNAFDKVCLIKKLVLGPGYVEGTWVGFYGPENNPYYAIDQFRQTLSHTSVSGQGYVSPTKRRSSWNGRLVFIEAAHRELSFHCDVTVIPDARTTRAITKFDFVERRGRPHSMDGTSTNIDDGQMFDIYMKKYSDDVSCDVAEALKAAMAYRTERTRA